MNLKYDNCKVINIRRCELCGAEIDPKDWCYECMENKTCKVHKRRVKRKDAKYCSDECRITDRNELRKIRRELK